MEIISTQHIDKHYNLSSIVGKKVISSSGQVVGRVKEVAYDLTKVLGIIVNGTFGKVLIGREYIDHLNTDSVILKINPVTTLVGKLVFDRDGKKIGKVAKVVRANTINDFTEVMVKKNPFMKQIKVPKSFMDVVGKNIILNKSL